MILRCHGNNTLPSVHLPPRQSQSYFQDTHSLAHIHTQTHREIHREIHTIRTSSSSFCIDLLSTAMADPIQKPSLGMIGGDEPNVWQSIIRKYSKDLQSLPLPPKNFTRRSRMHPERRNKKGTWPKNLLARLKGGEKKETLPIKTATGCRQWELRPMSDTPPQPRLGVPSFTVTTPEGETMWPKNPNSNMTQENIRHFISCAKRQHNGADHDSHCASFAEARRKCLHKLPRVLQPQVLFCLHCWEDEDAQED